MRTHFWEFRDLQAQMLPVDIDLDLEVEQAGIAGASKINQGCRGSSVLEPNHMYAAINQAGKILREMPAAQLAKRPIEIPPEDIHPDDIAVKTLLQIVNASLGKVTLDIPPEHSLGIPAMTAAHACDEAESYFAGTLLQMEQPDQLLDASQDNVPYGFQVITSQQTGAPVGIRKGISWPTMLTLETIAINGIPYPPGSIMRADLPYERERFGYRSASDFIQQESMPLQSIERLGFMRLSAFALAPEWRASTFSKAINPEIGHKTISAYGLTEVSPPIIRERTIESIRQLATAVLPNIRSADYEYLQV